MVLTALQFILGESRKASTPPFPPKAGMNCRGNHGNKKMNIEMFHAVYYHAVPLTALEFAFLMTLVGAAKNKDYLPSPLLKRIANRSGMSKGAVVKASQSLQRKGIIET